MTTFDSSSNRRTARTFTYKIPLDDRHALRKINVLDSLHADYFVYKLDAKREVPTYDAVRDAGYVYYQSKESFDYDRNQMVGGTIPALSDYRVSLSWQQYPDDSLLKMRNSTNGGTEITGERHVGFSDSRISDYVNIETVVKFTPTEIEAVFNGDDLSQIDASEAREIIRDELRAAEKRGIEDAYKALEDFVANCDHTHVLLTNRDYGDVAFCEDCGRDWDRIEFQHDQENDNLQVVGSV